jgi:TRAF-type zinc finger.
VDELAVECIHRSAGCPHICQRQLLLSHTKDSCQYSQITCSEGDCDLVLLRRDAGKHAHNCVHRLVECDGCGVEVKFIELDVSSHGPDCLLCMSSILNWLCNISHIKKIVLQQPQPVASALLKSVVPSWRVIIHLVPIFSFPVHTSRMVVHGRALVSPYRPHTSRFVHMKPSKASSL